MVETMRDVLSEPVEIRGGVQQELTRPEGRYVSGSGVNHFSSGGYSVGIIGNGGPPWDGSRPQTVTWVEIKKHGLENPLIRSVFEDFEEAKAEFARLKAQLEERETIEMVLGNVGGAFGANILPAQFVMAVQAGELYTLLVAADYCDEHDQRDDALLLRSQYYSATKAGTVTAMLGKRETAHYNAANRVIAAAVVVAGESVRTIAIDHGRGLRGHLLREKIVREYKIGTQAKYGSFNMTYFGPITSITDKSVMISEGFNGGKEKKTRFSIAQFAAENYDFDLAQAEKRNNEWMD